MALCRPSKCFVCTLQNPLGTNVDPRASGHLAVHHQPGGIQLVELFPRRPTWHQIGVCNQDPRCQPVCLEHSDSFPGLHQQRLVILEPVECFNDLVIALPVARRLASSTINDQLFRLFGHIRIKVVHQHPFGCFLNPPTGRSGIAAGSPDWRISFCHFIASTVSTLSIFCSAASFKKLDASSIQTERTQSSRHAGIRARKRARASSSAGVLVSSRRSSARVAANNSIATTILASVTACSSLSAEVM